MDGMEGIRSRIREVVKKSGLSEREFSRGARLASESHVSLIVTGRTKEIQLRTLEKIAAFGGVSVEYLRSGRGDPAAAKATALDEHPDAEFQAAARAFLELRRFSEDAASVVADYAKATAGRKLDADEWFEELLVEHRRRDRGISFPEPPPPPPVPPSPPRAPRPKRRLTQRPTHAKR